jgi:hypothetical protein
MLTRFRPTFHSTGMCAPVSLEEYAEYSETWSAEYPFSSPPTIASAHIMYNNERDVDIAGVKFKDLLYMVLYPWNFGPKVLGTRYGDHVSATWNIFAFSSISRR